MSVPSVSFCTLGTHPPHSSRSTGVLAPGRERDPGKLFKKKKKEKPVETLKLSNCIHQMARRNSYNIILNLGGGVQENRSQTI